jgi:hypothetical protein
VFASAAAVDAAVSFPPPFTGLHDFPQDTSTSKARLEFECVAIKAAE